MIAHVVALVIVALVFIVNGAVAVTSPRQDEALFTGCVATALLVAVGILGGSL